MHKNICYKKFCSIACYNIGQNCPLTEADFVKGREVDVTIQLSEGLDNVAHNGEKYQGDIVLTPEQYRVIAENKPRGRNLNLIKHWTQENNVVTIPYIIAACDYTADERSNLARAIEEYKNKTCIRYKKK